MVIDPSPIQRLFIWRLVATGGEDALKSIKPKLAPAQRKSLRESGLLQEEKKKPKPSERAIIHCKLTEKGWEWASENMDKEFSSRAATAGEVLHLFLSRLKKYFEIKDLSLGQFVLATELTESNNESDLESEIEDAYFTCSGGRTNIRVKLADLRLQLKEVPKRTLDDALLKLAQKGTAALYPLNDPKEVTPADREAVVKTGAGQDRHIIYLGGMGS